MIVVTKFEKDCDIYYLDEEMFFPNLGEILDDYIDSQKYKNEFPDCLVLNSKDNIAQMMDINNGNKFFVGIFPRDNLIHAPIV